MTPFIFMSKIAYEWAGRCFGWVHVKNGAVRGLRHVEEAAEICQVLGVSKEDVIKAIDIVYSRPPGDLLSEIGGSILTLSVLCESHNIDLEYAMLKELNRVLAKDPAHFAARNAEKVNPGHG